MKFCIALLACIAISFYSFSQTIPENPNVTDDKGLRQGKWTILFDANNRTTARKDSASVFRIINYRNDKPIGLVQDFFISGKVQWEGYLLADRPNEILDKNSVRYREDGTKEAVQTFKNGKLIKETVYNLDGSEVKESFDKITSLAMDAYSAGDYEKCVSLFERRLEQAKRQFGERHPYYIEALNDAGVVYGTVGMFSKAEASHLQAMNLYEDVVGKEDAVYSSCLNNLAEVYRSQGKYAQAKPLYAKTVQIESKLLGWDNPEFAITLQNFARLYHTLNQYDSAIILYRLAEDIYKKNNLLETYGYSIALNGLASVYFDKGDYPRAQKMYGTVLNIRAKVKGKDHPSYILILNNIGTLYYRQGNFIKAEAIFKEVAALYKRLLGPEDLSYALALNNLATVYNSQGKFVQAEPLLIESTKAYENKLGKLHPDYVDAITNLAQLYYGQGNYLKAEIIYREAIDAMETAVGKNSLRYIRSVNNLATMHLKIGEYKKSEKALLEAKKISEDIKLEDNPLYATIIHNLAVVYADGGGYSLAHKLYSQVREAEAKTLGTNHADYAHTINSIAELSYREGDFKSAENFYKEALAIRGKTIDKRNPLYTKTLQGLAQVSFLQGKTKESEALFNDLLAGLIEQLEFYFPALSEYEKEAFYAASRYQFEAYNSFAIQRVETNKSLTKQMYNNQLITKAMLFNTNDKIRSTIVRSNDTTLIALFEEWQMKRNKLSKAYQMTSEQKLTDSIRIDQLEAGINSLEKKLSSRSELFVRNSRVTSVTWKDIQNSLTKNEAAIEIIRIRKSGVSKFILDTTDAVPKRYNVQGLTDTIYYAALIVTEKSKYPEIVLLKNGRDLELKYIKGYRNSIKFKVRDSLSYDNFWEPIARKLKKNKIQDVYISPDGVYNSLNLSVLLNVKSNRYVSDEVNIKLITNTKDIVARRAKRLNVTGSAVLIGYPEFDHQDTSLIDDQRSLVVNPSDSIQRFFAGGRISKLPGTLIEINDVNDVLVENDIKSEKFTNENATEEKVKSIRSPNIVHIATHGFFLENSFAKGESFAGFDPKIVANPLFRSGILLAGAQSAVNGKINPGVEDGILTAYEAMNLNLDETELVVLSACETGLGEIRNGEGVYGLQRAFQTAGAKSVLMSLWKVDDHATQELMTSFYKNWLKSGDKRDAFKRAQATVRVKYKHPYYWGAFVLVGE